jgi:hypothetical protein
VGDLPANQMHKERDLPKYNSQASKALLANAVGQKLDKIVGPKRPSRDHFIHLLGHKTATTT